MPYITEDRRAAIEGGASPQSPGELNYAFTCQAIRYLHEHHAEGYQCLNDIVGALEGSKQEFIRRAVIPYEDQKVHDNGDLNWYPSSFRKD